MADMKDVGAALTGRYVGQLDENTPEAEAWSGTWSEIMPLKGKSPEEYMKGRQPDEEGVTFKGILKDSIMIRKPKPVDESIPMS